MIIGRWHEINRSAAIHTLKGLGYGFVLIADLMREGRDLPLTSYGLERAPGYTHAKDAPNDHCWRLVTAQGRWFYKNTDISHRLDCDCDFCEPNK